MVIRNWREVSPTIVHNFGIDYKLLKGQENFDPAVDNYCMISGTGTITINEETRSIRDGDAIYITPGDTHSIANTGEGFLIFLAFSAQV